MKFTSLLDWQAQAKQDGFEVKSGQLEATNLSYDWQAFDANGKVRGKFCTTKVPQNSHGFITQMKEK